VGKRASSIRAPSGIGSAPQAATESLTTPRVGAVEELVSAALFGIRDPFVTGTVLAVDGGGSLA
jgi:NAD(P)-dependent dehydrogenase (short-subunit alcohol dehydrogenase family)